MKRHAFYHKSCESMDELGDDTVTLTVTSPPYWNAIDYDRHTRDAGEWYRTREGGPYEAYLEFIGRAFAEVLRVTRPSGFCAVVIGTVLHERRHYPVPYHVVPLMERIGWLFHQDIAWYKTTGGVKRARVFVQQPYPGYFYPNLMTEHILIFRKPGRARSAMGGRKPRGSGAVWRSTTSGSGRSRTISGMWRPSRRDRRPTRARFPRRSPIA